MQYPFERVEEDGGVIVVSASLSQKPDIRMIFDTGASCSIIDKNVLLMMGCQLDMKTGSVCIETANGVIEAEVFEIETLSALGITRHHVQIQVYDYLLHGIFSNYQGVLGLDFFEDTKFTVNMKQNTIEVLEL